MEIARCYGCKEPLSSSIELGTGICTACNKLLEKGKGYATICWNCNSITSIQEIPRHLKGAFTENVVFSPKCGRCGGTKEESEAFITLSKFNPEPKYIEDYLTKSLQSRKTDHNKYTIIYDI